MARLYWWNSIPEEEQAENKEAYKEIWVTENEDFLDAIIENVDYLDEVEYLTDALDYETYQEAEVILNNLLMNYKKEMVFRV